MRLALHSLSPSRLSERFKGRAAGAVLAIAIELLVIAALLTLGRGYLQPKKPEDKLATFQVLPEAKPAPRPASRATKVTRVKHDSGGAAPKAPTQEQTATPEPKPETPLFIPLSKEEMAAADIGRMASASGNDAGDGRSTGRDSGAAYGPGEGPGGERAYEGDWVRLPTPAEIGPYLPANLESGEALIVCRAIPGNRVDNCRSLSETPGSGLGRALRLAAWQFHIRPTRIGSKFLVGQWVLIHWDFTMVQK
jgi:protein TonB